MLYYLPHSPASCSETSDSSSTASTTKRKRNTWGTAEEEILLNLCGEHKSGLKGSGSLQKWQQNITTWSSKSAILLFYLMTSILRRKKDGDWYIYPQFLAHENFNNVHKKVQKGYKIFKPRIHNVLSTGTNIVKIWLSLCLIPCVRFARYCGKMYSRHLFSYGGLSYPLHNPFQCGAH